MNQGRRKLPAWLDDIIGFIVWPYWYGRRASLASIGSVTQVAVICFAVYQAVEKNCYSAADAVWLFVAFAALYIAAFSADTVIPTAEERQMVG